MQAPRTTLFVATLIAAAIGLSACGGGGGGSPGQVAGATSPPFEPSPPPAAWADDGCVLCHGSDGSGGAGPDIRCSSFERLDATLRAAGTTHAGGAFPQLTDAALLEMVAFLRTADCAGGSPADPTPTPGGGVPPSHTENEDGVLHHPDYETNLSTCTTCHGAELQGTAFAPSCASCHGTGGGFDDDAWEDESETEHEDELEGEHETEDEPSDD